MENIKDEIEFDETETIRYILQNLSKEHQGKVGEKEIQAILDSIFNFYEEEGLLDDEDGDDDDEIAIDSEDMELYIQNDLKEQNITIEPDLLSEILDLEYKYEQDLGVFE